MFKKLLHLYNDGHVPFPHIGKGGLGYHLPQYRKRIHGDGLVFDSSGNLIFVPELKEGKTYDMTEQEAQARTKSIRPVIDKAIQDYTIQHMEENPQHYEPPTQEDIFLESLPEVTKENFYDPVVYDLLSRHNINTNENTGVKGLKAIAKELDINIKGINNKDPLIRTIIDAKDKRKKLKKILENDIHYGERLSEHKQNMRELNSINKIEENIRNEYKHASDKTINEMLEKKINDYRTISNKKGEDYNYMLYINAEYGIDPFKIKIPNIDIEKINNESSKKDIENKITEIQNYKYLYLYDLNKGKRDFMINEIINPKEKQLIDKLDGYTDLDVLMSSTLPNDKEVYTNAINYFRTIESTGSGIALESFLLSDDFLPLFKKTMDTDDDITQTSKLESIPDKDITFMNGKKGKLSDACMVDFLSETLAIDIKDYRGNKSDRFDVQKDKVYGSSDYTPVYIDSNGTIVLQTIRMKKYNNKDIVPNSNRQFWFYMIFDDGIYKYNLLDDDTYNINDNNPNNLEFIYNDETDTKGKFINRNLVKAGYLRNNENKEPSFFRDHHDKECFKVPKSKAELIVKFI